MKTQRPDLGDVALHAATVEDIDLVVDLINAAALVDTGQTATHRGDKLIEWGLPQFNPATDTLLLTLDGQPAGYVELWDTEPHVQPFLWGRVPPDYRGRGIGSYLVDWAEARAHQSLDKAPPGARVAILTTVAHRDEAAHELFEQRDYTLARRFYRMLIEMSPATPPPTPVWPEGVRARPYALGQEDRAVHRTLDEVYKDHWGYVQGEAFEEWFHWIEEDPRFDPSLCFVAVTDKQIVGVVMARLEWEADPSFAWIDELGVLRPWRRQGIGLALLHQVFGEFHRRGRYKVGLGVDAASLTGATRLYERAGMATFMQFDAYEKVLRPGIDLSTQT